MVVKEVTMHMNSGNDDTSYANNSFHQKIGISKSWDVLDECLIDMFTNGFPKTCFKLADLGCASGPNTFLVVSHIIEKTKELCKDVTEFKVYLNDLPENDFNNVFKMLPSFYQKINNNNDDDDEKDINCFVSGLPGSFYGRLLPSKSIDFFYSSYSLHWLSKIPQGLENNRDNVHLAMASPSDVRKAYAMQFERDLSTFLSSHRDEMFPDGRMVLTFVGRSVEDPSTKDATPHLTLFATALLDMVAEGIIKEGDLHSFNMPLYTPCRQEVESIIHNEGSFNLDKIEVPLVPLDAHAKNENRNNQDNMVFDVYKGAEVVSKSTRAYTESFLESHFGSSIIDELFRRYEIKLAKHFPWKDSSYPIIVVCLTLR